MTKFGRSGSRGLLLAGASALMMAAVAPALADMAEQRPVTWEDILNDQTSTDDVLMYGMGVKAQRYSALEKINVDNVGQMKPKWSFSFGDEKQRGQEGQALVRDGVIYVTASYSRIFALDAKTGKELFAFQTGSGVVSCPVTFDMDGKQYVAFSSGYGGAAPLWGGDMADQTKLVSQGGSFWVFEAPERTAAN